MSVVSLSATARVAPCAEDEPTARQLQQHFEQRVGPFLKSHCLGCHGAKRQEAKLDLSGYRSARDVAAAHQVWEIVLERLEAEEMPPEDARKHPTSKQRTEIVDWIRAVRRYEANRNAGDPGPVLARRLSNAEYNYAVRDLTGVDIQPTRTFPVDPANTAGFDNSGESLTMSPALLKKYLGAARAVSEHLVMAPTGVAFAPHPAVTETDRDKYCVRRIVDFYSRQPTDLADYFRVCHQFRAEQDEDLIHLDAFADAADVSARYARRVWSLLNDEDAHGPTAKLKETFQAVPLDATDEQVEQACRAMRDYATATRRRLSPRFENLTISGSHKGSQPFVLWKNDQYAAYRRKVDRRRLSVEGADGEQRIPEELKLARDEELQRRQLAAIERFCSTIPNAFYVSERGRDYLDVPKEKQEKGRLLSAGFHSMMGYYRDDRPLYDLILTKPQQAELDRLWEELDAVADAPIRQYLGFLWFERTDSRYMRDPVFDFARAENRESATRSMIRDLAEVYLDKAKRLGGSDRALKAIEDYFQQIDAQIRKSEKLRAEAESGHRRWLVRFAERAWRRRLSPDERSKVAVFYQALRDEEKMSHVEAMRDSLVSILMSPHFLYRLDLASGGAGVRSLTGPEAASRLSFFLWSSIPDDRLQQLAADSALNRPDALRREAKRLLADARSRALTKEFAANWLDIRRFEEHNAVDRNRFPEFTDELRAAMFEEPLRFLEDLIRRDGSVLEMLYATHTFANGPLAAHYGFSGVEIPANEWVRVDDAHRFGRGGLMPMAVFLTKNSPGLRTSPVKRGYWVVRRLLGERIPPPPPNVPELPEDESKLGDLSLREILARHRDNKSCAGCHDRFDAIGLAFEGFGPVGRLRKKDLGGRPVETKAVFPGGVEGDGVAGLRDYIKAQRQEEFVDNLCRKLLAFALGRTLMLSDEPLIATMKSDLAANDYRFSAMIETIVVSRQFRTKRGDEQVVRELR